MHTHSAAPSTNLEPPQRHEVEDHPGPKSATDSAAQPKEGDNREPGFRLHSGPPDYENYRYGYPPTPGYMFGSGN